MAVSAMWIRKNMLSSCDQYERQFTEAELKVQRSLQKLSIPDWYLNKRSSPPKILNNVTPIGSHQPPWKSSVSAKNSTINSTISSKNNSTINSMMRSTSYTLSDTLPLDSSKKSSKPDTHAATYRIPKEPKSPEPKHKKSPSKSTKNEPFDTTIPEVKRRQNISKTFPKISPPRKIQNINIVFLPRPELNLFTDFEDDKISEGLKYNTFVLKKQPEADKKKQPDGDKKNTKCLNPTKSPKKKKKTEAVEPPKVSISPVKTPNSKAVFKFRTTSTPKFTPANIFSSTLIEEAPKKKKAPAQSILDKSSIFEDSSRSLGMDRSKDNASTPRRLSQSFLDKTTLFEDTSKSGRHSRSVTETPRQVNHVTLLLQRNIRSIEPIVFEKAASPRFSVVRDFVRRMEVKKDVGLEGKLNLGVKDRVNVLEKKANVATSKGPVPGCRERRSSLDSQSPCTRFLNSRRKSTDLENVVKSKQVRERSMVREIISALSEKVSKSTLPRQSQTAGQVNRNFVRKVVNVLEKGDTSELELFSRSLANEEDPESCSESEGKSSTSVSLKDTDSGSDTDQRSPVQSSDDGVSRFDFGTLVRKKAASNAKTRPDDDSVYWIPVSRCKLPRTSSLISMMSRLSANGHSPCVSPIRSDSELEQAQTWGATFKKQDAFPRKLFRIDETIVIDSGYSDRSDRSGNGSTVDSTWSEDTQNDSGSEVHANRMKRSRRKSIALNATMVL